MPFRVCRSLDELPAPLPHLVLGIGNFDGMHRGHQRIFRHVVREARARNGTAAALTFDPHPSRVLAPASAPPLLITLAQKLSLLEAAGIELVLVLPFTRALAQLSPLEFVREIVHRRLAAELVLVGSNFRFGHGRAGNVQVLGKLSRKFGFAQKIVLPVKVGGQTVSSSLIRRLVADGRIDRAARLLGRPFAVTGAVQPGARRGAPLGFPTLNLLPEQECLPARGVYITETLLEGEAYHSATNVGVRPTFGGQRLVVESHLLDFSRTVAEGRLEVRFHHRLRKEKKFRSPQALRAQIARDVERTRRYFAQHARARTRRVRRQECLRH